MRPPLEHHRVDTGGSECHLDFLLLQRRIDIALEGLPSQKAIANDILVFGSGDTDEESFRDHDRHLKGGSTGASRRASN